MALFYDPGATAGPFRTVDRAHGVFCPRCKNSPVIKHGRYRKHLQRYLCKDCCRTFNDKTDTILHYRHIWMATGYWHSGSSCAVRPTGSPSTMSPSR